MFASMVGVKECKRINAADVKSRHHFLHERYWHDKGLYKYQKKYQNITG